MEACLVELLWLLEKSHHFQVGPTCHAHIWFLPPLARPHAWCAGGGGATNEGPTLWKIVVAGGGGVAEVGPPSARAELCPATARERSARLS
jgi:hypothetical protein